MAPGDDSKKKVEEEDDLFSQLPGYKLFAPETSQTGTQSGNQSGTNLNSNPNPTPAPNQADPAGQNPWFPTQSPSQVPVYPVNPGYVGPAEPLAPSDIVLPQLRPQDDPNSSEYIPRTPVLNAPSVNPNSPWVPVPEPKWELFVEQNLNPPQMPNEAAKKPLPAGGSQANPILFNALPIVTGDPYATAEPAWPGAAGGISNQPAPSQSPSQPSWPGMPVVNNEAAHTGVNPEQLQQPSAQTSAQPGQPAWPNANPHGKIENNEARNAPKLRSKFLNPDEPKPEPEPQSVSLGFNKNDIIGIATYNLNVTKDILTNPQGYFQTMPLSGGYGEPLLYTVFACIISSSLFAVAKLNPLMFFWAFFVGFLSVTLGAFIVDQAFRRMGSKGNLEGTFRVLAYAKATFVISWIALGPLQLGLMLATMITGYMNYIGLMRVHGLSPKSTIIIVALMSILSLVFRWTAPGV